MYYVYESSHKSRSARVCVFLICVCISTTVTELLWANCIESITKTLCTSFRYVVLPGMNLKSPNIILHSVVEQKHLDSCNWEFLHFSGSRWGDCHSALTDGGVGCNQSELCWNPNNLRHGNTYPVIEACYLLVGARRKECKCFYFL